MPPSRKQGSRNKAPPPQVDTPSLLKADPFAEREASKYENPIPSREFILKHLEELGKPASHMELCNALLLFDADEQQALEKRLVAMTRDGQLISNRRGVFGLVDRMDLVKGKVIGHKDGYGFVSTEDGKDDLYLGPAEMRKVFDGDTVLAKVAQVDRRGRREGRIVEVLERKNTQIVGRYYSDAGIGVVMPHNKRITQEILIPPKKHKKAQDGDYVVVELTQFPHEHRKAMGEVIEVLGDIGKPGMEIDVALRVHDIRHEWPTEVDAEMREYPVKVQPQDLANRVDLRALPFVTIDGEDAKDFDDAILCQKKRGKGYVLYVAIADVSHYVKLNTALDTEAYLRGNSVYFPGHVVPMLPEHLSNGLCSLKPKEDRLVMVCELQISKDGQIESYEFFEGVIHSHARLTYTEVAAMLQTPQTDTEKTLQQRISEKHRDLLPHLQAAYALYKCLLTARAQRGALDIETVETRLIFSEQRRVKEIVPVERNDAHKLIEECMLCANVAAADLLQKAKLPALYRIHEGPNEEKLENLYEFLRSLGIGVARKSQPTPKDFQQILLKLAPRPDRTLLQTLVIRSLMQAQYSPENLGHFGLGFDAYTHFTSPIRRYPDLLVHRGIRFLVRNPKQTSGVRREGKPELLKKQNIYPYRTEDLILMGSHLSQTERKADAASWDVIAWLKCEYMQAKIGEEFAGIVSKVSNFGLFVELKDVYVEGLLHVTALTNDYYHYDEVTHSLTGERNGLSFHLGDQLRVVVSQVNVEDRKIDLQLAGSPPATGVGRAIPKHKRSGPESSGSRKSGRKDKGQRRSRRR
jgi:ribonuclease R